jgi:hypothetical protein
VPCSFVALECEQTLPQTWERILAKDTGQCVVSYGQKTEPVKKAVNCAASVAGPEGTR